jgi:bifunctional DNA-binding transcriptional regulator/antitoxin component of YhaV-PrlF toxin-antitoxin module
MAKVTSKFQVTVPQAIAQQYGIRPGDDIDWVPANDVIRVIPGGKQDARLDRETRLRLFDQATERQRKRTSGSTTKPPRTRGWTREDLYQRGRSR